MTDDTQKTHISQMTGAQLERFQTLKRQVETPHDRVFYGQTRTVEPTFCDMVLGNGAYMLIVTAVRTAPAYHVLMIDSSWVRHVAIGHRNPNGIEPDLDDPDRRDLISEILVDVCGDGDAWHEEHGEASYAPKGYFHAEMGYSYGLETLGPDGLLEQKSSTLEHAE